MFPILLRILVTCGGGGGPSDCTEYDPEPDFACDHGLENGLCQEFSYVDGVAPEDAAESCTSGPEGGEVVDVCPHTPGAIYEESLGVSGCSMGGPTTGCRTDWYHGSASSADLSTQCLNQGGTPRGMCGDDPC